MKYLKYIFINLVKIVINPLHIDMNNRLLLKIATLLKLKYGEENAIVLHFLQLSTLV